MACMSLFLLCASAFANEPKTAGKHGIKVLILCTGNTCRSQMAHGLLASYGKDVVVYSGGVRAEKRVNPKAVMVMRERGIDISDHTPCKVDEYLNEDWDYVITVCNQAQESCPTFAGRVRHRAHLGFRDPASATGTEAERRAVFREVRNQIIHSFNAFYNQHISKDNESEERL